MSPRALKSGAPAGGLIRSCTAVSSSPWATTLIAIGPPAVPGRQVVGAVDGGASAVHHAVGVERIDLDVPDHPAELGSHFGQRRRVVEGEPGRPRDVLRVVEHAVRPGAPLPDRLPGRPGVRAAPEVDVGPPAVQLGDHDRVGVLRIDGETAIAEPGVGAARRVRRDLRPDGGPRVVLPDVAFVPVVRSALVVVRDVEDAGRGQHAVMGHESRRGGLAGKSRPGRATVRAAVDARAEVGDTDVDGLGRSAGAAGAWVEHDPGDAERITPVAARVAGILGVRADAGREAVHPPPGPAEVGAPPESVAAAGAQVEDAVLVRIDDEALAHVAAGHVPTGLEGQDRDLPAAAPVPRPEHGPVVGVPGVRVDAGEHVDTVGVHWIRGQAVDTRVAPVVPAHPVQQRDPAAGVLVPAIRAADVGAGVHEIGLAGVEDDSRHVPAADDLDVAPDVLRALRVAPCRRGDRGDVAGNGDCHQGDDEQSSRDLSTHDSASSSWTPGRFPSGEGAPTRPRLP